MNALMTTAHVALTAGQSTDFSIKPPPIAGTQKILVRRAEDPVMDLRYSDTRSFLHVKTQPAQDHVDVHVDLCCPTDPRLQLRYKASWRVGWSEVSSFDWSWVDDQTPPGAALNREGEGWIWVSDNVFVGSSAHRSPLAGGLHQHSFTGASSPMVVQWQDTLFAMVYLDPDNPPDEVMLQWHTPNGWVQAFWGDDLIQPGSDGPPGRVNIGPLPPTGEWVRLDVKAQSLGISAPVNIDGMAFTLSGGQATWDYAGRNYANEVFQ